ncbi:MAG: tetratricopeptide repeat protein [Saprospirales bacterium]|nr:tetratricopeptide repeat protein [Saprospirales bacterium]MBK8489831.1 tetratricopeptide repeat protein [Saprospirales bacterium]
MSTFKVIFSGRLEFGSERSFHQVVKFYQHRFENYYRKDVLLKVEEIFEEETQSLNVTRFIGESGEKTWRNTVKLIEYMAEFAIAGDFQAWMTSGGQIVQERFIEPASEKAATQAFLKGRALVDKGEEAKAKVLLDQAIEKFARHAQAYERRGKVNFRLKNFKDALYDFTKSINIHPDNPDAYVGRAAVKMVLGDYKAAIEDLEMAVKSSIPHQPIFWQARRMKGECHILLEEFPAAIKELKLVTTRAFKENDPNYYWLKAAFSNYGKALLGSGQYAESVKAFNMALSISGEQQRATFVAESFLLRGIARQKAGEGDFANDWKEAAGMGSERAASLLQTLA